jgi:hypothetical protein
VEHSGLNQITSFKCLLDGPLRAPWPSSNRCIYQLNIVVSDGKALSQLACQREWKKYEEEEG